MEPQVSSAVTGSEQENNRKDWLVDEAAVASRTPTPSALPADDYERNTVSIQSTTPPGSADALRSKMQWRDTVQNCLGILYGQEPLAPTAAAQMEPSEKLTAFVDLLEQLHQVESFVNELTLHRVLETATNDAQSCLLPPEEPLLVIPTCSRLQGAALESNMSLPRCWAAAYTWKHCFMVLLAVAVERAPHLQTQWLLLDYLTSFMIRAGYFQQAVCSACLANEMVSESAQRRGWHPQLASPVSTLDLMQTKQVLDLLFLVMRAYLALQAVEYAEATLQLCEQILKHFQTLASGEIGHPSRTPVSDERHAMEQAGAASMTPPGRSEAQVPTPIPLSNTPLLGPFNDMAQGAPATDSFPSARLERATASPASTQQCLEVAVQASRAMLLFHRGLLDSIRGNYEDGTDAFDAAVILFESLDQVTWDSPSSSSVSTTLPNTVGGARSLFTAISLPDWVRVAHNNSALCRVQTEELADALEKLDRAKRIHIPESVCSVAAADEPTLSSGQATDWARWEGRCIQMHYDWVATRAVPWELQHASVGDDWVLSSLVRPFEDTSLSR
jgi:hypothetical protein